MHSVTLEIFIEFQENHNIKVCAMDGQLAGWSVKH